MSNKNAGYTIYAHFSKGYALKNTIAILRHLSAEANFIFTREGITLNRGNVESSVLVVLTISGAMLDSYEMNAHNGSTPVDILNVGLTLKDLYTATKPIKREDGIILYMKAGDTNLYISIISSENENKTQNINLVNSHQVEACEYAIPQVSSPIPNVRISPSTFAKTCNNLKEQKCLGADFENDSIDTIMITGKRAGNGVGNICKLNNEVEEDCKCRGKPRLFTRRKVTTKTDYLKILAKLSCVCEKSGSIDVHVEDGFLKLTCGIANYGSLQVYLKNID